MAEISESNELKVKEESKSKTFLCPMCNEACLIRIEDFKIKLYGCKNAHQNEDFLLKDFEKYKKYIRIDNLNYNNIEIIISDKLGVGKTTQIIEDIKKQGKKRVYFPISGFFSSEDINKRLKNLQLDNNIILHLDIFDSEQTDLINKILFSILILEKYEDIFTLPKNIHIKIELQNSSYNYFVKYPILTLFNIREMKISNIPPLIVPNSLDSNIQIVANYLKALKEDKISKNDLYFPNITPLDFKSNYYIYKKKKYSTIIDACLIPDKECELLIFEEIKKNIPLPNYYEIISFINILAGHLIKFNQNYFLNAHQLIVSGKMNNCSIRTFVVEMLIKLAKYLVKGAFSDKLKQKEKSHVLNIKDYDELKNINNMINALETNKNIVSFSNLDTSLLFFNEGYSGLYSIVTNKQKDDKEYIDLLSLKNIFAFREFEKFKSLKDYKTFTQKDFLYQFRDILDITNPIEKNSDSKKVSLEEMTNNYIFTPTIFVRMVVLILKLRANIPVVILWENAREVASFVEKISEMKNGGSLNFVKNFFLVGELAQTNNAIIDFLKKVVIPEANSLLEYDDIEKERSKKLGLIYEGKKIWVLFGEINKCKSIGLISEILCNHSCQGEMLPSNIVFLAHFNPYAHSNNEKYCIIPDSLLNYAIDFGKNY